jgi:hypothetical protein
MAIASGGTLGTGANSTSNSSFTFNTATNTLASGNFGILTVVSDNIATADGKTLNHLQPSGGTGRWSRLAEYTNAPTASAGVGVTTSIWLFEATGTVNTGTTITVNFSNNVTDKCCSFWKYTVGAGAKLVLNRTGADLGVITSEVNGSNGFGSSAFAGLSNISRLYFRGLGKEANSTTDLTVSSGFTLITLTRSRNNAAAVIVRGEFRIVTATGETSNPTLAVSGDTAGLFLALEEVTPAAISTLTDNFDDNSFDTGKWTDIDATGGSLSETGNRLELTTGTSAGGYAAARGVVYDVTGSSVYARLPSFGGGANATFDYAGMRGHGDNGTYAWTIAGQSIDGIEIQVNRTDNDLATSFDTSGNTVDVYAAFYDSSDHAWFRIRHETSDDTLYFDTAPSSAADPPGSGEWVNRWSEVRAMSLNWQPVLEAKAIDGTTSHTTAWDGFNTAAVGATNVAITGVSATGSAGSVGVSVAKELTGQSATGSLGTLTPTFSVALTGVGATGAAGVVSVGIGLTGQEATGAAGSVSPVFSVPITGVGATGEIGDVEPQIVTEVALTGVQATGSAGSVSPVFSVALTGAEATGAVGTPGVSFSIELSGVEATGAAGTVSPETEAIVHYVMPADFGSFSLSGQDAGFDYDSIEVVPTQVPGGGTSSAKKKKKKVIRFSDFAARDEYERELRAALMPLIPISPESIYEDDEDDILIEMLTI